MERVSVLWFVVSWLIAALAGIAIHLAAAYLKPNLDRGLARVSTKFADRIEGRRREGEWRVNQLSRDPRVAAVMLAGQTRIVLYALFAGLLSISSAGLGLFSSYALRDRRLTLVFLLLSILFILMAGDLTARTSRIARELVEAIYGREPRT